MKRFAALLQREWMQHQRGWTILVALPLVVVVLAAAFGGIHVNLGEDGAPSRLPGPAALAMMTMLGLCAVTLVLAWGTTLLQTPGLARRDVQDRSIEFWLSLPISHSQSVGATLLTHLLLVPWAALAIGLAGGLLVSPLVVTKTYGLGAWWSLPWPSIIGALVALWLRLSLGVLLATLWLSPLIVGAMAASAWLKRWGVPVFVGGLAIGNLVLERMYGVHALSAALQTLMSSARQALIGVGGGRATLQINSSREVDTLLPAAAHWLWDDAGQALWAAATPAFLAALLVGAAAFALLVWRRQRGG